MTDDEGYFRIDNLGPYSLLEVNIAADGFAQTYKKFQLQEESIEEVIVLSRGIRIEETGLDFSGAPVSGADVFCGPVSMEEWDLRWPKCGVLATSGPDGRFGIRDQPPDTQDVVACAPGYGMAWARVVPGPIQLYLPKAEQSVMGRVVDSEGRPIEGAQVRFQYYEVREGENKLRVTTRGHVGESGPLLEGMLAIQTPETQTGPAGEFSLEGLDLISSGTVGIEVERKGFEPRYLSAHLGQWLEVRLVPDTP
jgi:hypothetical protein